MGSPWAWSLELTLSLYLIIYQGEVREAYVQRFVTA